LAQELARLFGTWLALNGTRASLVRPERDFASDPLYCWLQAVVQASRVLPTVLLSLVVDYCASSERDADWFAFAPSSQLPDGEGLPFECANLQPLHISRWRSISLIGEPEPGTSKVVMKVFRRLGERATLQLVCSSHADEFNRKLEELTEHLHKTFPRAGLYCDFSANRFDAELALRRWISHVLPIVRSIRLGPDGALVIQRRTVLGW